ncbi:RsmE family RNA methyltransferase [Leadbettera azotonutricia]|uniref:Ribosomal RNA small subunit methyltransferase E n=1 Tax=Leadbettera azotonutricia (strain ATCC BAA-888 / DSM 13862 / ZAS-9) TaxID=545695 RepID=F5YDQ6_LEAAZ|nr:RsmE family RNA methyltransferase [Leadbettera azotonutricia]AEF80106.1 RNA methyltransferase superfamily [Leadbettera azotonutricia ZAS-9]
MKQFVLSYEPNANGIIRLYGGDYHYLIRVRRLKTGSSFTALLPGGAETRVKILSTVDNILIGQCEGAFAPSESALPPIILFQGLPKGTKMDLIVRQAAEGGVSEIIPFESEFSTAKLKGENSQAKMTRWERIIKEARQQSGSIIPTAVKPPCTVDGVLGYWGELKKARPGGVGLLLHQDPLDKGSFHDYLYNNPEFAALAVGPEGGFSPAEAARFMAAGFKPLVMGNTILRTETAALYGAAAIRIILLESSTWALKTPEPPPASGSAS